MEYRVLEKTGLRVPKLSFGAPSLVGVFRHVVESDAIRTGHLALESGINFIDVCLLNWLTEAETVLVKALKGISPNKYYLATKVERPPVLDPLWQPGKSGNN